MPAALCGLCTDLIALPLTASSEPASHSEVGALVCGLFLALVLEKGSWLLLSPGAVIATY